MNTAIYSFLAVPIALIISVALAWFIFSKIKHTAFFETMFLCHMLPVQSQLELYFAISLMVNTVY